MGDRGPTVAVVGAGIIGASIAWHLARGGARVKLIEAAAPGGIATPNSFSWINSNFSFAREYFELRHHAMGEWRRLAGELPQLPVSLSGSIYLPAANLDLEEFVARNAAWGYRIDLIGAKEIRELEPRLTLDVDMGAHAHDEGAAESEEVARLLAEAVVEEGGELLQGTSVDGLACADGGVTGVQVGGETIAADEVVVAAGVATADLVSETGFVPPLTSPPGLLVHTKPVAPLLNGLVLAEGLHMRQKANGQLLAGRDFHGGTGLDDPEASARASFADLADAWGTNEKLEFDRYSVGYRPMPADGVPIIGRPSGLSGLYLAVTHSGVTLCPALGAFAAREILQGDRDALLAPFGPERFDGTGAG
ncbi:MAG: FAD-dependent oxidoreductase [Pseudomonadota bacterium]